MKTPEIVSPAELLAKKFPFEPTPSQTQLFNKMGDFILAEDQYRQIFVLKGYAGTGKTTFISTLIKVLPKVGYKSTLLAPTGRAAKVMANYSKKLAVTIHKKIYRQVEDSYTGNLVFQRQKNYQEDTIFIVDEASMISDEREFGRESLLKDLLDFVFEHESNKLILIGDEAQLPPVGTPQSPALNCEHLRGRYYAEVFEHQLVEVMRQDEGSGILANATELRKLLDTENPKIRLTTKGFSDIYKMNFDKLEDGVRYAYDKFGAENTIIITRSNKSAVQYNQYIRNQINFCENEVEAGDVLMVVRNNYTVLDEDSKAGFIANGDFVEVKRISNEEEIHGFRFADAILQLVDYPNEPEFESKIILSTLNSTSPTLSQEENKTLYENVMKDYFWVKSKTERAKMLRKDAYLNALQVKFAYALTCHKSQGGQWDVVFIDHGFLPELQEGKSLDNDFIRWLYTAITRASKQAFLVNFNQLFF